MTIDEIKEYIDKRRKECDEIYEHHDRIYGLCLDHKDISNELDEIKFMLEQLDNEWVDVNDRLPSKEEIKDTNKTFDVTTYYHNTPSQEQYGTDIAYFDENSTEFEVGYAEVIAWKKRPKPYKREE